MRYPLILIALIFPYLVQAQKLPSSLDECSQVLVKIETAANAVTQEQIDLLLASNKRLCLSSVEFSEWVNELIYSALTTKPNEFIFSFSAQTKEIRNNILNAIQSPIHDGIDIEKAFAAIKNTKPQSKEKEQILESIKIAGSKAGLEL
jgi:hypothetical protein